MVPLWEFGSLCMGGNPPSSGMEVGSFFGVEKNNSKFLQRITYATKRNCRRALAPVLMQGVHQLSTPLPQ